MDNVITAKELAEYLKLSEDHIRRLTSRSEIPYVKIGHSVRYRMSNIDRWLSSKMVYCKKEINEIAETYVTTNKRNSRKATRPAIINNSTI